MSDHDDVIPSIIAAAISAAGPMGSNPGAWKAKINAALPHVASMVNDRSRQWAIAEQVLGASVFVATYVSHEIEQSSTRALVKIDTGKVTKNYPDGIEPIRTHRTDQAQGRAMAEQLDKLSPGDEMIVWKAIETNDDGDEKYRVLVHFETRPKRKDPSSRGETAPAAVPADEPGRGPAGSGGAPSSERYTDSVDSELLQGWRAKTRATLGVRMELLEEQLKENGYDFDGVSEIEWVEIVRPMIRKIVA